MSRIEVFLKWIWKPVVVGIILGSMFAYAVIGVILVHATAEDGAAHLNELRPENRQYTTGEWNSYTGLFHETGNYNVVGNAKSHYGFDPVTGAWTYFVDLPEDSTKSDMCVGYDGDLYVVRGGNNPTMWYWNREADTWLDFEDLPEDVADPTVWYNGAPDYRVYVLDGDTGADDYRVYSHSIWAVGAGGWIDEGLIGFDIYGGFMNVQAVDVDNEIYGIHKLAGWETQSSFSFNKGSKAITQIADNRTAMGAGDTCYLAFEYQDSLYGIFASGAAESLNNAEVWEYTGSADNSWTVADNTTDWGSGLRNDGNIYDGFCLDGAVYLMNAHNESAATNKVLIAYPWWVTPRILEVPPNAGSGNKTGEDIENIFWVGLRCAYADENLAFVVSGNISADVALSLVSEGGSVLSSTTNTIRSDGVYIWQTSVTNSYRGFVRCIESNTGVQSEWGYIHPAPDDSMTHNYGYARYTSYPQDDISFESYVVDGDDMLVFHWGTDLEVADLSSYYVGVWREGLYSQYAWYGSRLDTLLDDYYKNWNNANDDMVGYRFLLMALNPGAGYEDYDGLIYRMNIDLDWESEGFYEVVIYDGSQNRYTDAASVYWYLEDAVGGFAVSLDDTQYLPAEEMTVYIDIGEGTSLLGLYDTTTIYIYNSAGGQARRDEIEDRSLNMQVTMVSPVTIGTYDLTVKFEDDDQEMDVVQSVSFYVVEEEGGPDPGPDDGEEDDDPWPTIPFTDTAGGRWSLMLTGMLLGFVIVKDSAVLRVAIPLGILGLGIVLGWVEAWIVVLLALGAGFTLFGVFKKKFSGGYQE